MSGLDSGDSNTMDTTPTVSTVSTTTTQDHIQALTDFHARLQSIRHIPSLLLRPPSGSSLSRASEFRSPFDTADHDFAATFHTTPVQDFRTLKAIAETLCSDKIQEALKVARESEDTDKSDLDLSFKRDSGMQRK